MYKPALVVVIMFVTSFGEITIYTMTTPTSSERQRVRCEGLDEVQMTTVGIETEMVGVTKQQDVTCSCKQIKSSQSIKRNNQQYVFDSNSNQMNPNNNSNDINFELSNRLAAVFIVSGLCTTESFQTLPAADGSTSGVHSACTPVVG